MEQALKAIMDKLDSVDNRLDEISERLRLIEIAITSDSKNLGKSLGETNATLGGMRLG